MLRPISSMMLRSTRLVRARSAWSDGVNPTFHGLRWKSTQAKSAVIRQLNRVSELRQRVSMENSKTEKERVIADYPDLRALLER